MPLMPWYRTRRQAGTATRHTAGSATSSSSPSCCTFPSSQRTVAHRSHRMMPRMESRHHAIAWHVSSGTAQTPSSTPVVYCISRRYWRYGYVSSRHDAGTREGIGAWLHVSHGCRHDILHDYCCTMVAFVHDREWHVMPSSVACVRHHVRHVARVRRRPMRI